MIPVRLLNESLSLLIALVEMAAEKRLQFLWPAAYPECELRRIVCWQEILSPSYYPLERPLGFWNAPWRNWNGPGPLERPPASGTEPKALPGTPAGG